MKKLMVAIAAVATAFGLYADGQALTGSLSFDGKTPGPYDPAADGGWAAYTGDATKLKITDESPNMLDISTGTAALKRNVANDGAAWVLDSENNTNLYFETTIDFKGQVLDDVPDVTGGKLAIFALDGTEVNGKGDLPDGTNVYVYAGYGTESKALYLLSGFGAAFPTEGVNRKIVVKTWANVFSTGTRSGFILYIQNGAAKTVLEDADIAQVQGVFTWDGAKWDAMEDISAAGSYLGGAATSVHGTYGKWVNQRSLFLNLDSGTATTEKFTTLDFQGNAKIAGVNITDVAPVTFPADSISMPLTLTDATITDLTAGYTVSGNSIIGPKEGNISFKVSTEKQNVTVTLDGVEKTAEADVYTVAMAAASTLVVKGWDAAATVTIGGVETPYETIDAAIAAANGAGAACTLKLSEGLTDLTSALTFANAENEITLDLAGKAITGAVMGGVIQNNGLLKIVDNDGDGYIQNNFATVAMAFAVANSGTLEINGGEFKNAVKNNSGKTLTITGGKFDAAFSNSGTLTITGGQFKGYEKAELEALIDTATYRVVDGDTGYLKVEEIPAPTTFSVTAAEAAVHSTLTVQTNGVDLVGVENVYTANIGDTIVVTYTADTGYEFNGQPTVTDSFEEDNDTTFATAPVPTIKKFALTLPDVEHASAVVSNATEDITAAITAIDYGTVVTVYWTAEDGWKITDGATEEIEMTEAKTAQKPTVEADAKEVPGEEILPAAEKDAYRAWAEKNGVKDTDTELGNELVVAYKLGVDNVNDADEAVAAAQSKADEFLKDVDLSALAAGGSIEEALKNLKLPAGLTASLVEVPQTEIETTASLFRLRITANSAN